jgi:hypothetical protein
VILIHLPSLVNVRLFKGGYSETFFACCNCCNLPAACWTIHPSKGSAEERKSFQGMLPTPCSTVAWEPLSFRVPIGILGLVFTSAQTVTIYVREWADGQDWHTVCVTAGCGWGEGAQPATFDGPRKSRNTDGVESGGRTPVSNSFREQKYECGQSKRCRSFFGWVADLCLSYTLVIPRACASCAGMFNIFKHGNIRRGSTAVAQL